MYDNHRKSFHRGDHRDFGDDRYRFGEDRFREGRGRDGPRYSEGDRGDAYGGQRAGYGGSFRDDDQGRYSGYGPDGAPEYWRGRGDRGHFSHDPQHQEYSQGASSFGYGAGQPYGGGDGDSRYFTGQQGSWALRSPGSARGRQFGADYREHGYASHRDGDERGFWDRASDEVASWFGDEDAAQRRELDHRGRGPKDYTRSDERIREDANDRLTEDARIDASNVTLTVQNAEITLNGTVGSRHEKRRAEDLVERISGVKHVQNNLRVSDAVRSASEPPQSNWTVSPGATEGGTINQSPKRQTAKV